MTYIVTHTSPDWDAIGYAWLMQRYGGAKDMPVKFVNTGAPDPALLADAYSVGDTGREFDPKRRRFDHHHLPGAAANETCATHQAYMSCIVDHVHDTPTWRELHTIGPIVRLIYHGDTGKPEANESRLLGIHALLSTAKTRYRGAMGADELILAWGFDILDNLAAHLIAQDEARRSLAAHTVYTSADGLVVALLNAPQGATFAAHEAGARLVVFHNEAERARGVMRGGESADVHVGGLVSALLNDYDCGLDDIGADVYGELAKWYRHQAGFFAGRGTVKAPVGDSCGCDIRDIAKALDAIWFR
jgi:hypothetical protein